MSSKFTKSNHSFTLVELLISVALVAIIATVVILVLNPSELLRQARDSRRLNDLSILNRAINMYIADTGGGGFYGSSSVVYVSIPDSSPTCSNLGLPSLPSGWSYHCAPSSTLQNIDGSGWIPINFNLQTFGRSITRLPIDPINQTSTLNYYTYVTGGSFVILVKLESQKYKQFALNDGGIDPTRYELGTNLEIISGLISQSQGLVGYWTFDEGSGNTAYDYSGNNNSGTLYNGPTWQSEQNCKVGKCLNLDGVDDYINIPTLIWPSTTFTICWWMKANSLSNPPYHGIGGTDWEKFEFHTFYSNGSVFVGTDENKRFTPTDLPAGTVEANKWIHFAYTHDGTNGRFYKNGTLIAGPKIQNPSYGWSGLLIGRSSYGFGGFIDELRIYNKALSNSEIQEIYDATK